MYNWTQWTAQQYQHHNVSNIQQATWFFPQAPAQYSQFPVHRPNLQADTFNRPVSSFLHQPPASVYEYHRTKQFGFAVNSFVPPPSCEQRPLDIAMNPQEFYQISRFNEYSVHFPNRTALSVQQVREICSDFGEIGSCKQTGNETGLFFVNFKTEDSALKCVEGLRNHPVIKLRPNKLYIASKNRDAASDVPKKYDCPPSSSSSSSSGLNNFVRNEKGVGYHGQSNHSYAKSEKSDTADENGFKNSSASLLIGTTNNYSTLTMASDKNDLKCVVPKEGSSTMEGLSVDEHDSVPIDVPELVPAAKASTLASKTTKDVMKAEKNGAKRPVEVLEAQEIIVANIEDNYGVPAILHLFEKYDPICASPIKICKSHSIRYCHVFFTNLHQAETAEYDFDDYEWSPNKKLIVLRANSLASIASTA